MNKKNVIVLGPTSQVPIGQGRCFVVQGHAIAVFRSRKEEIFAVENRCPHRGGPLADGVIGSGKVICPLHGHKFDLATGMGSEARECVRTFKVWSDDGQLMMENERVEKHFQHVPPEC